MSETPEHYAYLFSEHKKLRINRGQKTSTSMEQLIRSYRRLPVLVYERVEVAQYFHFIKRYQRKLLFVGKMVVPGILLLGVEGSWYPIGTKDGPSLYEELTVILGSAKLDRKAYRMIDWGQSEDRFIIYIMKNLR